MGRRPEQTLLQRASADGCQAHEKPRKVAGQQREAKQDRSEVSPTPVGTALTRQSDRERQVWARMGEKGGLTCRRRACELARPLRKTVRRFLETLSISNFCGQIVVKRSCRLGFERHPRPAGGGGSPPHRLPAGTRGPWLIRFGRDRLPFARRVRTGSTVRSAPSPVARAANIVDVSLFHF